MEVQLTKLPTKIVPQNGEEPLHTSPGGLTPGWGKTITANAACQTNLTNFCDHYSMHSIFFPDDPVTYPPVLPLPGQSSGESEITKPITPPPPYVGQTFALMCKLWTISQEVLVSISDYKSSSVPADKLVRVMEVEYQKLLSLADSGGRSLSRTSDSPIHVMLFQLVSMKALKLAAMLTATACAIIAWY